MLMWSLIISLTFFIAAHYYWGVKFFKSLNVDTGRAKRVLVLMWVALITSINPLLTLCAFAYVFLQGGSFYAQYSESHELWSLWFSAWTYLAPTSLLLMLVAAVAFFMDMKKSERPNSFKSRLSLLIAYAICLFIFLTTIPDA